jgi:hypothetical protein
MKNDVTSRYLVVVMFKKAKNFIGKMNGGISQ